MPGTASWADICMVVECSPEARDCPCSMLDAVPEAIAAITSGGYIAYLNQAGAQMLGIDAAQAIGRHWWDTMRLYDDTGRRAFTVSPLSWFEPGVLPRPPAYLRMRREDVDLAVQISASAIRNTWGEEVGTIVVLRDVTETRDLLYQLSHLCAHDPLTGLANRREFELRLEAAIKAVAAHEAQYSLLYMDLDGFKTINDAYGHCIGDTVLVQVADRLRAATRPQDTLARLGGDEFGLLMRNKSPAKAADAAKALREAIRRPPFAARDHLVTLDISIGVVLLDPSCGEVLDALNVADAACYQAKRNIGGGIYAAP